MKQNVGLNVLASFGGMFGIGQLRQPVPTCLGSKCGLAGRQAVSEMGCSCRLKGTLHAVCGPFMLFVVRSVLQHSPHQL